MAVKELVTWGDPNLYRQSESVDSSEWNILPELIGDLRDTMNAAGGIGIAAPQIGVLKKVAIIGFEKSDRYPGKEPIPETVLINPEIEILSNSVLGNWEGCLSVPGMRGYVERSDHISLRYQNIDGETVIRELTGFPSVVVQHECDHLDGVIFPMRISDFSRFGPEETVRGRPDYS